MNDRRLYQIIKGPLTTEKSVRAGDKHKQTVLKVALDATKTEIAKAVAKHFNVEVTSVQTSTVRGKTKRFKQQQGKRTDWKKAYVSLKDGQDINFANY